jgi:hypothetical protein
MLNERERAYVRLELIRLVGRLADKLTRDREPLDGDDTEDIARFFQLELDYTMGNITTDEWENERRKTSLFGR